MTTKLMTPFAGLRGAMVTEGAVIGARQVYFTRSIHRGSSILGLLTNVLMGCVNISASGYGPSSLANWTWGLFELCVVEG